MTAESRRNKIVEQIAETWRHEETLYQELQKIVHAYLTAHIAETETFPAIFARLKSIPSMAKTAILKGKRYTEINDKLGFRIVCHFKSELGVIRDFINRSFNVHRYEAKADRLKFDQLGYVSDHYEVSIDPKKPEFQEHGKLARLIFEIQVRTICQHAWADVEHQLAYKQEVKLDDETKRRVFRLTALLEICDDEFDQVNTYLLSLPESRVFRIIKVLEGKFFKLAKRDYDREWSYSNVELLLSAIKDGQEVSSLKSKLEEFLSANEERMGRIFRERKAELERNVFFSQPEVMLIWYLLETRMHDLILVWQSRFDQDELVDISTWWGKPIPTEIER